MPAPPLSNTFEGGTDGVAITAGNSGGASGDAFSSVDSAPGIKFSNVNPAHGTMGARCLNPTGTDGGRWTGLGISAGTDVWFRGYFRLNAWPTADLTPIGTYTGAATNNCYITISSTGVVIARDTGFGAITGTTGSVTLPTGAKFRLEARIRPSATVGQVEWKWWSNPEDTGTPTETKSASGVVLGTDLGQVVWGNGASVAVTVTEDFDDIAVSTVDWIGPVAVVSTDVILPTWPRIRFNG